MKALYRNRLCHIVNMATDVTLADEAREFVVSLGDEALVIDPSDSEVAGADNFGEWFGVDHDGARQLRGTLRGDGLTKTP